MRPRLKQFTPHNSLKYSVLEPDTLLGKTFSLSFSVSLLSLSLQCLSLLFFPKARASVSTLCGSGSAVPDT